MYRGNISNVIKLLIFAAGIILSCILVAIGFYVGRSGKNYVNNGTNQYAKMMSDYDNLDITMYDGLEVPGQEVRNFIEHFSSTEVNVFVHTTLDPTPAASYNKTGLEVSRTANTYINPVATFVGKVERNQNGIVDKISFIQKK